MIINHSVPVWRWVRKGPLLSKLVVPVVYYGNRARHPFQVVLGNKKGSTVHTRTAPIKHISSCLPCFLAAKTHTMPANNF